MELGTRTLDFALGGAKLHNEPLEDAFEAALKNTWSKLPSETRLEAKLVNVRELAFADPKVSWGTPLVAVNREPGKNNVGMVALTM
ncbi:hypothetical protein Tco_0983504 [Tanacetum coccineum]